jgi:hypothetical protein
LEEIKCYTLIFKGVTGVTKPPVFLFFVLRLVTPKNAIFFVGVTKIIGLKPAPLLGSSHCVTPVTHVTPFF